MSTQDESEIPDDAACELPRYALSDIVAPDHVASYHQFVNGNGDDIYIKLNPVVDQTVLVQLFTEDDRLRCEKTFPASVDAVHIRATIFETLTRIDDAERLAESGKQGDSGQKMEMLTQTT